jgi:2,5-diketo-D-gluconate reductase B
MKRIKSQGANIPRLGLGTFRMFGGESQSVVESVIALGFHHIDMAAMYENEAAVGAPIAARPKDQRIVRPQFAGEGDAVV